MGGVSMVNPSVPDGATQAGSEMTPTAFEDFYRTNYHSAARLAYLTCGSESAAEDLAQEAFVRVHPRYETLDNPAAYLRVTLLNLVRSWHRAQGRRQAILPRLYDPASVSPTARELLDVLGRLPFRHRAVLVLRYWEGLSEREIAECLGVRPGTVKSLASRGLSRLRNDLEEP